MTELTQGMRRLLALVAEIGPVSLAVLSREECEESIQRSLRERVNDLRGLSLLRGYKPRLGSVMLVEITDAGRTALAADGASAAAAAAAAPAPIVCQVAAQRDRSTDGQYDGRELQPYTGRPGAMRAFHLPSLQNGTPVERRAPIIMGCTPQLRGSR